MTRALILAAGQGTRLRPITDDKPKCLVPLKGKSLLERQVSVLNKNAIDDIHIATGYRADQITALGFESSFNKAYESTNMVESLFAAMDFLEKEGDLIISYGDIVYQSENLRKVLSVESDIVLMIDKSWKDLWSLRLEDPLSDAETLILDGEGCVRELGKKPESYEFIQGQYTGLIKVSAKKISAFIDFYKSLDREASYDGQDFNNMYMTSLLQLLIDAGWKVKAAEVEGGWLEVDSVEDLELYESMAVDGSLDKFCKLEP